MEGALRVDVSRCLAVVNVCEKGRVTYGASSFIEDGSLGVWAVIVVLRASAAVRGLVVADPQSTVAAGGAWRVKGCFVASVAVKGAVNRAENVAWFARNVRR